MDSSSPPLFSVLQAIFPGLWLVGASADDCWLTDAQAKVFPSFSLPASRLCLYMYSNTYIFLVARGHVCVWITQMYSVYFLKDELR